MLYFGEEGKEVITEEKYRFLCITRHENEDRYDFWPECEKSRFHDRVFGKIMVRVYGVQIDSQKIPVEVKVEFVQDEFGFEPDHVGVDCPEGELEVESFGTGLSGGVHTAHVKVPEEYDKYNYTLWRLYLDKLTEKGRQRGDDWGGEDPLPDPSWV